MNNVPHFIIFFFILIHVRTSGPDTGAKRKESTIAAGAAPEATGHGLAQARSVSDCQTALRNTNHSLRWEHSEV